MTATIDNITLRDRLSPRVLPVEDRLGRVSPRIVAFILLAGAVRRNELVEATGRSRLDLPIDERETVLNQWQRHTAHWLRVADQGPRPLRVFIDGAATIVPASGIATPDSPLTIEHDPQECRGTGGLLRDLAESYQDDDWLLVASGAQLLLEPLAELVEKLCGIDGDVRLLAHADRTPVGLMLIRCGSLRKLDRVGFVDLKEQALPRIARTHRVGLLMSQQPTSLPILTCGDYVRAIRQHHLRRSDSPMLNDPFAEDWRCGFSVIEAGAQVDAAAHLHDCVVLRSAVVEAGATVVRSLVCSGGVVRKNQVVSDQLVRPGGNTKRK